MRTLRVAFTSLVVSSTVLIAAITACGGGNLPPIDAAPPDGSAGSNLPVCTGAVYDPCTDTAASSDCMAGPPGAPMCKAFMGSGFTVCTQTCITSDDCPMQNGSATFCNPKGICKPGEANACMHP